MPTPELACFGAGQFFPSLQVLEEPAEFVRRAVAGNNRGRLLQARKRLFLHGQIRLNVLMGRDRRFVPEANAVRGYTPLARLGWASAARATASFRR